MSGTVLIFGAGGFVGPWLAREFLSVGYRTVGCDLRASDAFPAEADFRTADLLDPEATKALMAEVRPDIAVNLAAVSSVALSWQRPRETLEVNVLGAVNLLEAARSLDKKPRLLMAGSGEVYAPSETPLSEDAPLDAASPYAISKAAQEQLAAMYRERWGVPTLRVRAFNHTGPGQSEAFVLPGFAAQAAAVAASGKPGVIRVGNLDVRRDFSHVADVVRAYRLIAEKGDCRLVYNVGSGVARPLRELLDALIAMTGAEIRVETDPARLRPVDNPVVCCDSRRLRETLGWKPEKTVFDALRELYRDALRKEALSDASRKGAP